MQWALQPRSLSLYSLGTQHTLAAQSARFPGSETRMWTCQEVGAEDRVERSEVGCRREGGESAGGDNARKHSHQWGRGHGG